MHAGGSIRIANSACRPLGDSDGLWIRNNRRFKKGPGLRGGATGCRNSTAGGWVLNRDIGVALSARRGESEPGRQGGAGLARPKLTGEVPQANQEKWNSQSQNQGKQVRSHGPALLECF